MAGTRAVTVGMLFPMLWTYLWWVDLSALAQQEIYDPATTAQALLNEPISDDDIFGAAAPTQEAPDEANVLYEISVHWGFGLIWYQIYPSVREVTESGHLDYGLRVDLDRVPGKQANVLDLPDGNGACSADLNVLVCAVSNYYVTDYPAGAAVRGVESGLIHLRRVAAPPAVNAPSVTATSAPRELPAQTPATMITPQVVAPSPTPSAVPTERARDDSSIGQRIIAAAVQIAIIVDASADGIAEPIFLPVGSGTVVSANGLVLTNAHVVDFAEHRRLLDARGVELDSELLLVLTSDGESPPVPRYFASVAAQDTTLDLAVLQVLGDETGLIDSGSLNLPFAPLGDSDTVQLGDSIDIYSFPAIGGNSLTFTRGVVSGFEFEPGINGRAWINTDAGMSGGSSGGTAVNERGELIGIPTQGSELDCRPGDTNNDGVIDGRDAGCIPTGMSLGQLRPINLALDLLSGKDGPREDSGETAVTPPPPPPITPTPTPTPPPPPPPSPPLPPPLLDELPLPHATCFRIEGDGNLTFDELTARLGGTEEARDLLQDWGWQGSAYRIFACDEPPDGELSWVEINAHRFGDTTSAQQAVDYFAAVLAEMTGQMRGPQPAVGDYAVSLGNPDAVTIYASQGPVLVRVTGVAPSGIPFGSVQAVTQAVLDLQLTAPESPGMEVVFVPAAAYLPVVPDVNYSSCFSVLTEGAYSYRDVVEALQLAGLTQSQFDGLGWRDGAYRVFTCPDPPAGRASQIDVVIHQFQDARSAQAALPYFSDTYDAGENESRSCDDAGPVIVCVTGQSLTGSPLSDVHFVVQQVVGSVGQ